MQSSDGTRSETVTCVLTSKGLYKGCAASVVREGFFSSYRLGIYGPFKTLVYSTLKVSGPETDISLNIITGALVGVTGSVLANPFDLVKIRMMADKENGERRRYSTARGAFANIVQSDGMRGLFVGIGLTAQRAAVGNASQLAAYDWAKTFVNDAGLREGFTTNFAASFIAGFCASLCLAPFDIARTRLMTQASKGEVSSGILYTKNRYTSTFACMITIVCKEGIFGLYKGFIPTWMRMAPHSVVTFTVMEQLKNLWNS
jgi:hypothetical protein